jgi:hypothetical protein
MSLLVLKARGQRLVEMMTWPENCGSGRRENWRRLAFEVGCGFLSDKLGL